MYISFQERHLRINACKGCVGLVLYYYYYYESICIEDFPLSDTSMGWVFDGNFVFDTIRVYIASNNLHT